MNQTALLHIVERLEGFLGKLPETIRKPILNELTPIKELFLQQRPPRFLFVGSGKMSMPKIVGALFAPGAEEQISVAVAPVHRWTDWNIAGHGNVSILDARDASGSAEIQIREELRRQRADVIFFVKGDLKKLTAGTERSDQNSRVVGISTENENHGVQLPRWLNEEPKLGDRSLKVIQLSEEEPTEARRLISILARELPNEAKIEMTRLSRDREAQQQIAQVLVRSTTAICTAIGAQPIPLADMPILTTLQLVMVSGIMYVSGRERSLRAATEFMAALGANLGVGMVLREGARAILKFFPGWGNVVCGMVAGAGTFAIGRAATAYFLEGVSLKDARQTYRASRKKRAHPALPGPA